MPQVTNPKRVCLGDFKGFCFMWVFSVLGQTLNPNPSELGGDATVLRPASLGLKFWGCEVFGFRLKLRPLVQISTPERSHRVFH